MVSVAAALARGNRDAIAQLAEQLAAEIDGAGSARDRLPLVRAFLVTVAQLESIDAAARRAAQLGAATSPGGPAPVDELLARRYHRAGRR